MERGTGEAPPACLAVGGECADTVLPQFYLQVR